MALQFLKPFTPEDIQLAIDKNIDLETLILDNLDQAESLSQSATLFDPAWTVGHILFWFSIRRPDLYKVLATEAGLVWVRNHWVKRKTMKETLEIV